MEVADYIELFLDHHRAMGNSPQTVQHYGHSLRLFQRCIQERDIEDPFTNQAMNAFAAWLRVTPTKGWRGSTERTIHGVHGALKDCKAWLRWLEIEGHIAKTPKVPVPRLPKRLFRILTDEELQRVFSCKYLTDRSEQADRNRALIAFMLDTAIRLGEAASLQYADVSIKDRVALIHGKGNKERLVYISETTAADLRRWISIRGEEPGSMFWLGEGGIRQLYRRIKTETGLDLFHPHQMRHTGLTMMIRGDMDLHSAKQIAGHASVQTTEEYLALAQKDIQTKHAHASPYAQIIKQRDHEREITRRLRTAR